MNEKQIHFEARLPEKTGALITGAGPTGIALAIALQKAGARYTLIDKLAEGLNTSRAGVIHAHTLEMLDRIGVADEMVRRGLRVTRFSLRDRDRALLSLDFSRLPSQHPYLLMLPQDVTERILTDRLSELGGLVHRNVTATSISQDADRVRVRVSEAGADREIRADWVIGADGMHSVVREAAGTAFDGGTYEDSFLLADVRMDWSLGTSEVSLFFSPAGMAVVAPLPNGVFRVVATASNPPEHPDERDLQNLLDSRGPVTRRSTVKEVVWSSRFRIHHRVARHYRNGRLVLMGDAAHVHSPAGGQGMNTGLVDAVVLGELLPKAMHGRRGGQLLDTYEQLRRPAASKVVEMAGRLTTLATAKGMVGRASRNLLMSVLQWIPPARTSLLMNLSGLSRRAHTVVPA